MDFKKHQLVTIEEAAKISAEFGLGDLDAHWWKIQGQKHRLPGVTINRRRRFLKSHVEAYIRRQISFLIVRTPRDIGPWLKD